MSQQSAISTEYIQILTRLGLTFNETRVFLALYGVDKPPEKVISKSSGVAREIVYQIMPKLQKRGLVEELVMSPKAFKAIPIEAAFAILFDQRRNNVFYGNRF